MAQEPFTVAIPDETLRDLWPAIEMQLAAAITYAKHLRPVPGRGKRDDTSAGWLCRTVQELDQYARAIRWVLTVTER